VTIGTAITDSNGQHSGHTSQRPLCWMAGAWMLPAEHNDGNHYLWRQVAGVYQRVESAPGVLMAPLDDYGGGTEDGALIEMHVNPVDPDLLHVLSGHKSSEEYSEVRKTGDYFAIVHGPESAATFGNEREYAFTVDSLGRAWVANKRKNFVQANYKPIGGSWTAAAHVENNTLAGGVDYRSGPFDRLIIGGFPGIGFSYPWNLSGVGHCLRYAYRIDAWPTNDPWIVQTVSAVQRFDDHPSNVAMVLPGDTDSTIVVACKAYSGGDYLSFRRPPGGPWEVGVPAFNGMTRVKLAGNEDTGQVYGVCRRQNMVQYRETDASAALVWSDYQTGIDPSGPGCSVNVGVPSHPVTNAMWLELAVGSADPSGDGQTWTNNIVPSGA
jgi:hypothetical protein